MKQNQPSLLLQTYKDVQSIFNPFSYFRKPSRDANWKSGFFIWNFAKQNHNKNLNSPIENCRRKCKFWTTKGEVAWIGKRWGIVKQIKRDFLIIIKFDNK